MSGSFDDILNNIMGTVGGITTAPERAPTIEAATAQPGAEPTKSVGVVQSEGTLPLVNENMTLKELREVMEKYGKVVERGAYLYEWTGGKAAKLGTLDPKELGRERMTAMEKRAIDWWEANGNKEEYDWAECVLAGKVPDGKIGKYNDELRALRWMYSKPDLKMENWFWVRKNSEARAHCVWALVKIVKAGQDLTNGLDTSDALGVAEYQTANKIISVASSNVRVFMEQIHKLLRPIDDGLNMVIARKIAIGTRLKIHQKKEGTANRQAKMFGDESVGKVTKPGDVPLGKKRAREETTTIEMLRKLKVSKKSINEAPTKGALPTLGHQRNETVRREASPEYRPQSPPPPPPRQTAAELTSRQVREIGQYIKRGNWVEAEVNTFKGWDAPTWRVDMFERTTWGGEEGHSRTLTLPHGCTRTEQLILTVLNQLLSTGRFSEEDATRALGDPDLWTNLVECGFGTSPARLKKYREHLSDLAAEHAMMD
ncbi:hypothetical protein [Rhizoctonia solani RNA Virus 11]|nr:hypothetical protein [Rhizoctonia solani RNA Virus 11]